MSLLIATLALAVVSCSERSANSAPTAVSGPANAQAFGVKGVVQELKGDGRTVVIRHEAIPDYMDAMTMPFKVKEPKHLSGLEPGDEIMFRLLVTEDESWIEEVRKTGRRIDLQAKTPAPPTNRVQSAASRHPLREYKFTNQLGQAVSLNDFQGQALALTFFFTRCPIPEYCPRLSKNFEEAAQKLAALPNAPTNWHLLSVTFDPEFDTPAVLKAYGERYRYDPRHWTFLTGPKEKVTELARLSDVNVEPTGDGYFFNHSFRTLIIDAAGRLQMSFPVSGNLSDALVGELLKAATNTAPAATSSAP